MFIVEKLKMDMNANRISHLFSYCRQLLFSFFLFHWRVYFNSKLAYGFDHLAGRTIALGPYMFTLVCSSTTAVSLVNRICWEAIVLTVDVSKDFPFAASHWSRTSHEWKFGAPHHQIPTLLRSPVRVLLPFPFQSCMEASGWWWSDLTNTAWMCVSRRLPTISLLELLKLSVACFAQKKT